MNNERHLMYAEGSESREVTESEIIAAVKRRGYKADNIHISYDDFHEVWRWTCDFSKLVEFDPFKIRAR